MMRIVILGNAHAQTRTKTRIVSSILCVYFTMGDSITTRSLYRILFSKYTFQVLLNTYVKI